MLRKPGSPRVFAPPQKLQATAKKNGETGADFAERRECALLGSPLVAAALRSFNVLQLTKHVASGIHSFGNVSFVFLAQCLAKSPVRWSMLPHHEAEQATEQATA